MNRLADELALRETHFINPNGLPAAWDITRVPETWRSSHASRAADPIFAQTVSTPKHGCTLVDAKDQLRNVLWTNTNRLLDTEGYDGVTNGNDPSRRRVPGGQRRSRRRSSDRDHTGCQLHGGPLCRRPELVPLGLAVARSPAIPGTAGPMIRHYLKRQRPTGRSRRVVPNDPRDQEAHREP